MIASILWDVDPVWFKVGSWEVRWYGLMRLAADWSKTSSTSEVHAPAPINIKANIHRLYIFFIYMFF